MVRRTSQRAVGKSTFFQPSADGRALTARLPSLRGAAAEAASERGDISIIAGIAVARPIGSTAHRQACRWRGRALRRASVDTSLFVGRLALNITRSRAG